MRPTSRRPWPGRERKGAILVLLGFSLVVLFVFIGLVVDIGFVYHDRRLEQKAADAAALAAATEIYRGKYDLAVSSARSAATTHGFTDGTNHTTVHVRTPPTTGKFIGNAQFAEVVIERPRVTFFARLLGHETLPTSARAVAGVGLPGTKCVYALDRTREKALDVSSGSILNAGCGVVVNSRTYNALNVESASQLNATGGIVAVTGGANITSGSNVTPTATVGAVPEPDPLGYVERPADLISAPCGLSSQGFIKRKVDGPGVTVLNPGVYCGQGDYAIDITSNGRAFFNPGIYVLKGGMKVSGGTVPAYQVEGYRVTFILTGNSQNTYKPLEFSGKITLRLTARTEDPLAGILFYQDPLAGTSSDINKIATSGVPTGSFYMEGALYFPTQQIDLATSNSTVSIDGAVIGLTVRVHSQSTVNFTNNSGTTVLKRISLVE